MIEFEGGKVYECPAGDQTTQRRVLGEDKSGVLAGTKMPPKIVNRVWVSKAGEVFQDSLGDSSEYDSDGVDSKSTGSQSVFDYEHMYGAGGVSTDDESDDGEARWTVAKSCFAQYRFEDSLLLEECFANDWDRSCAAKLANIPPDEVNDVKELVSEHYETLKNVFKYYSATCIELFTVNHEAFENLLIHTSLNQKFTKADLSTYFALCARMGDVDAKLNLAKSLTRVQFIDLILRLAFLKYRDVDVGSNSLGSTAVDAVENMLMQIESSATRYEYQPFQSRFACEGVDKIFKDDIDLLRSLYSRYSGTFDLQTETANMSLAEWEALMRAANLLDAGYDPKYIRLAYVYAVPTSVNEMCAQDLSHQQMSFDEWIAETKTRG